MWDFQQRGGEFRRSGFGHTAKAKQQNKKVALPLRLCPLRILVEFYNFERNQFLVWNLALSRIFACLTLQTMPTKEEIEERKHFFKILQAFKNYERDSKNRLERTKLYYERIPTRHKNLLAEEGFEDHLDKIKKCIETNYKLILQLIGKSLPNFNIYIMNDFLNQYM